MRAVSSAVFLMNTLPRIARFSYPSALADTILSLRRVRIISAMASDSMFSQNNPPLKNVESILVDVRKISSLYWPLLSPS
ncbi:hypothetical protein [Bradyrhizobium cajani]|uniref:Uncharacterized protein n=1 Tax=Bradyrhizobium cajani TaxID=1928661 RepID=A0A844T5M7_9BRAD|nr:hypothetical protein [Bradyrhizobium cajani]MCP3368673.1 hypothetical protein [Bradyrhizobium cajani]MVT73536.1 hypothetical protein [Bradyrhizobium cajani]